MLIDHIFPEFIAAKSPLKELLIQKAREEGLSLEQVRERMSAVPTPLIDAPAFLDKMTSIWRYEFGAPFQVGNELVFGTHMWVPVDHLHLAVRTASVRVPKEKQAPYFDRLKDRWAHWDTLVEMMPAARLVAAATTDFEVAGLGAGNRTVDWVIQASGRIVLLDAKSRSADFIKQVEMKSVDGVMPEPEHDPALLFRSVEGKFLDADPDTTLQGAWISTHIKQNKVELERAFAALNGSKVHFAVFGDWEPDVNLLVKREADREFLLELFTAIQSSRFTYAP